MYFIWTRCHNYSYSYIISENWKGCILEKWSVCLLVLSIHTYYPWDFTKNIRILCLHFRRMHDYLRRSSIGVWRKVLKTILNLHTVLLLDRTFNMGSSVCHSHVIKLKSYITLNVKCLLDYLVISSQHVVVFYKKL